MVQVYVSIPNSAQHTHPLRALKAFKRIELEAGHSGSDGASESLIDKIARSTEEVRTRLTTRSKTVELRMDKYAVSYWDEGSSAWRVDGGTYTVEVGTSSNDLPLKGSFEIGTGFTWNGL